MSQKSPRGGWVRGDHSRDVPFAMTCVPMDPSALAGCLRTHTLGAGAWGLPLPALGCAGSQSLVAPGWGDGGQASIYGVLLGWHHPWRGAAFSTEQVRQVTKVGRCEGPDPAWPSGPNSHTLSPRCIPELASSVCVTLPSPAGLQSPASNPASTLSDVSWSPLSPLGPQHGIGSPFRLETCSSHHQILLPCHYGGDQGCGCPLDAVEQG